MKRLFLALIFLSACGASPPAPVSPTAVPSTPTASATATDTPTATPSAVPTASCLTIAQQACSRACATDAVCYEDCFAIRTKSCNGGSK